MGLCCVLAIIRYVPCFVIIFPYLSFADPPRSFPTQYQTAIPLPQELSFTVLSLTALYRPPLILSFASPQILTVQQGNVYVWRMLQNRDITSLIPVTSFQAHTAYITRVLLSPDVRHLATCSADHNARIWSVDPTAPHNLKGNENLPTERQPGAFPLETSLSAHQRWVWDCAFSADSAYLVTACSDHYARLWELSSQAIIRQYNGHHRGAVCVALNDYSETR